MNYKQVDDLAVVWCEYGEMELRHENYEQALRILRVRHFYHSYTLVFESLCKLQLFASTERYIWSFTCCVKSSSPSAGFYYTLLNIKSFVNLAL